MRSKACGGLLGASRWANGLAPTGMRAEVWEGPRGALRGAVCDGVCAACGMACADLLSRRRSASVEPGAALCGLCTGARGIAVTRGRGFHSVERLGSVF